MKRSVVAFLLLISVSVFAGDPKYPVNTIPEELKVNVNAVYRENTSVFTILGRDRASHYVHQVITIFNARAKHYASEAVSYDKLRKVKSLEATVYDANGAVIKKLRNNDIEDQSAVGDGLFSDNRYKYFDLAQGIYPYTVEMEYEVEYKFLFYIPSFYLLDDEKISSEKASYSLQYTDGLAPRYRVLNTAVKQAQGKNDNGLTTLTWTFINTPPLKIEPSGPSIADI